MRVETLLDPLEVEPALSLETTLRNRIVTAGQHDPATLTVHRSIRLRDREPEDLDQ
jgi:hypothetical protein